MVFGVCTSERCFDGTRLMKILNISCLVKAHSSCIMFKRRIFTITRLYRTKGSLNKRTLQIFNENDEKADPELASKVKNQLVPTSEELEKNPNQFVAIYTKYGWFAILPSVFSYKWTKEKIVEEIEARFPGINESIDQNIPDKKHSKHIEGEFPDPADSFPDIKSRKPSILELQKVVDEWTKSVVLKEVPKTKKTTKAELEKAKDDVLYRLQLRADTSSPRKPKGTVRKKTISEGGLNYTHAWNYFYSTTYPQFSKTMPWKEAVGKVKEMWQELRIEEKEEYREKYAQLLREGKDIFRGKVVTIEEKEKINSVVAKYKERYRQKEKDRQDKIEGLAELLNEQV